MAEEGGTAAAGAAQKKTKREQRAEAWDRRIAKNDGVVPGGREQASCLSKLLFSWIGPLVQLAYVKPLEAKHLYSLPGDSTTKQLLSRFEKAWAEQRAKPKGKRSLGRALFKVFRPIIILTGIFQLMQQAVNLVVPLIVQQLLKWLIDGSQDISIGIILAFSLFVVGFVGNGFITNHLFLRLYMIGMDARSTLNGVTYAKSLRLSNRSRQKTSTGEAVTLMSNDAQRLPDAAITLHSLWSVPLFIIVAIFLLVNLIGSAAVAGILFLVLMIPIQGVLATKQIGLQRAQMKQTESRVNVINEVLQGIRIVKYYAWEAPFMDRISTLRDLELNKIKNFAFVNAYSMSIMLTTPFVMVMLTLITYYNNSGDFEPDVVFTAVSLLLVIRFPLMLLPMAIASYVQGRVSLGRLQAFFELEELAEDDRKWTSRDGNGKGVGVIKASGTFEWVSALEDDTKDTAGKGGNAGDAGNSGGEEGGEEVGKGNGDKKMLKGSAVADVESGGGDGSGGSAEASTEVEKWDLILDDVEFPAGKLSAVVGQVGSGKSSLVSALLGEMTKVSGSVSIDGSVAYVAQSAWIINATLKDNILMGRPFNATRYEKVLRVCDMAQDLAALPAGDETVIGEKGINLSGGQKQRVSIARAAYADADVYILDDPLSAVDAHVARTLFDECLSKFLKGKTIILCTNQLQFLPQTDLVIVLHQGRIVEGGTYPELMGKEGGGLAKLMETLVAASEDSFSDDEEDGEESKEDMIRAVSLPSEGLPPRTPARLRRSSGLGDAAMTSPWPRNLREASDVTSTMMENLVTANSPAHGTLRTAVEIEQMDEIYSGETSVTRRQRRRSRTSSRHRDKSGSYISDGVNGHSGYSRRSSAEHSSAVVMTKSASTRAEEEGNAAGKLGVEEGKKEGAVDWKVFRVYFRDGSGGWGLPILLLVVAILTQACINVFDWWLSYWSDAFLDSEINGGEAIPSWYQYIYAGLCIATVLLTLLRALVFAHQAVKASRHLHVALAKGVMRAPVSFFDTTPVGRVLNRFTKDMDSVDLLLPRNVPQFVSTLSVLIGTLITITAVLPAFIIAIVPIMFCYYRVQMYYRPINRDLQRLESVSRSPIFAQFSETLNGVSTLRAYNQQNEFIERNSSRLDDSARAFYHMHTSNRWLGIRLEAMGQGMNLAAALLIVFSRDWEGITIKAGIAGLVLTYTQQVTGYLNWTVRMGCETEARITAVERTKEYADLKPEAPPIVDDCRPPKDWPQTGAITLTDVEMRYRPGLDLVLKGVNINIKGGERIGIAGRTGSGKSSLMVALFRIVEPCGGGITIDGVNALKIGLQELREAISIIPQDPVMFAGTMRDNLDPFGRSDDVTIWAALEAARLSQYVSGLEKKLDAEVSEGGTNMSLGQRQLVCLARAVLRRNKILVMDEATANVDMDTDALIQEAIREQFSGCTVLTIAHRLNTIMDMDKILVMQDGKVGEFDTPANLVANDNSLLMWFINQTGVGSARRLVAIARGDDAVLSTMPPTPPGSGGSARDTLGAVASPETMAADQAMMAVNHGRLDSGVIVVDDGDGLAPGGERGDEGSGWLSEEVARELSPRETE